MKLQDIRLGELISGIVAVAGLVIVAMISLQSYFHVIVGTYY